MPNEPLVEHSVQATPSPMPVESTGTPPIGQKTQSVPPTSEEIRRKAIEDFVKKNSQTVDTIPAMNLAPVPDTTTVSVYTQTPLTEESHIVSEAVIEKTPKIITFISSLFFMITFTYSTLSLILFAVLVALTIALSNAGSPGFMYLRYYPKIGILPLFAAGAAMIFLYVAYRLRDGSRQAWIMAVLALATLPATFSAGMPILSYPLIKLVSVYAGSPEKPLITPGITVTQLTQIFSVFLIFDLILIALLITIRYFNNQPKSISSNAKTSLLILFLLFFVPSSGVAAYGYWQSATSDYGITAASNTVPFRIYITNAAPGGRVLSSTFQTNEELVNQFNAIKAVYDVPLPAIIQTGKNSPITVKQVQVPVEFTDDKYLSTIERDAGTRIEVIKTPNTKSGESHYIVRGNKIRLFALMPDSVYLEISSDIAGIDELTQLLQTLE